MTQHELRLPALAESVVEGEVLAWRVAEGDHVQEGQSVLELMTDKVTVELPSPFSGRIGRLLVAEGEVVAVGTVLALIESGEVQSQEPPPVAVPVPPPAPAPSQPAPVSNREERSIIESASAGAEDPALLAAVFAGFQRPKSASSATGTPVAARVLAVPSARQRARELGVHLPDVRGSGPNGTVRRADVSVHLARPEAPAGVPASSGWPPPAPPEYRTPAGSEHLETRTPFRGQRRAISQALLASTLHTAQTHTVQELDCTALMTERKALQPDAAALGVKLSYLPFFLKAAAAALEAFPALNSSLDVGRGEVVTKRFVHLGVAVNTDAGLIVPVIRDVPHKSLLTLAREVADLGERARAGTLKPSEMQDATFTVSNIGAVGALVGVPIVTPPAVGILSLHSIVKRPIAVVQDEEDVVTIRPMMYLTLGFDHRLVDGADAARFLSRLVELLEQPRRLYLQM
ncbi:dihydrolipoamide acetyltransferase family protein [Deinococcus ruber]|uniref:Dihydrolipoamide acetyltransferase component of pyruvate dehydrogenase complex n=1 Tax=Deinococcus ruber TaxID=1848197 RepID=A0A918CAP1_9DEIO|nr:dihydrolipoamide acetyltransferase family protein [Deinococcus ruber]GGR14290.1 dihydrolipoamide acetyltransferase component of pyruvate dehydrogenase complex [Deinococcus ruber]